MAHDSANSGALFKNGNKKGTLESMASSIGSMVG
jgi:hypothetical protein